jgi:hypothetical protein
MTPILPILATERHVLHDAVITDCILGNGEALDCYNQKLQDAATIEAGLENLKTIQRSAVSCHFHISKFFHFYMGKLPHYFITII